MTDKQLAALFENVEALDVPAHLRGELARTAWLMATCYIAVDYSLDRLEELENPEANEDAFIAWACVYATNPSVATTGRLFGIAESFLVRLVGMWRSGGCSDLGYTGQVSEPWAGYRPKLSPARQRRQQQGGE